MSTAEVTWAASGIVAFLLLPVGAIRAVAYRSREIDHTPSLRTVAMLALGGGAVAFLVFLALTVWLLVSGAGPGQG